MRDQPSNGVIEELLPATVATAESMADQVPARQARGRPGGRAGRAAERVAERQRDFIEVRALARRGLRALGVPEVEIPRGPQGAPVWPPGVVGSFTHCAGYRAAAVARTQDVRAIGLDAEPAQPLPRGVLELISDAAERRHIRLMAERRAGVCWERLLFCAKEAVYKAWFPLTSRWLDFTEVAVEFDVSGRWYAALRASAIAPGGGRLDGFAGRWLAREGFVMAAATHQ